MFNLLDCLFFLSTLGPGFRKVRFRAAKTKDLCVSVWTGPNTITNTATNTNTTTNTTTTTTSTFDYYCHQDY